MNTLQRAFLVVWLLGVVFGIALAGVIVSQATAASRSAQSAPASFRALPSALTGAPQSERSASSLDALDRSSGGGAPSIDPIGGATPGVTGANDTAVGRSSAVVSPRPASGEAALAERTPQPSARLTASWYDDGAGLYAALRSFRWGMARYRLRVCGQAGCVTVTVRDHCPTAGRIDLSPDAFRVACGPLSRGLCSVRVDAP